MKDSDPLGAILLVFDASTPSSDTFEPVGHAIMSEWTGGIQTTKLVGVRSLSVQE